MTMSNQMALSAASVAVMANNNTLVNMGAMQQSFFELDGSTINASLEATSLQATAEQKSIIDQAEVQRTSAGLQLGGAAAGMAATITGLGMGTSKYNEADALMKSSTPVQVGLTQVPAESGIELKNFSTPPSIPATPAIEPAASSPMVRISAELDSSVETSTAYVEGQLDTSTVPEDGDQASVARQRLQADEDGKAANEKAENPNAKAAKGLRSTGDFYMQNGNTFGGLLNTAVSSWGGVVNYNTTIDQANQSKIKDLEQGLAGALNTQAGLINSQLGNLDQSRSNTYQLMSTLQHVQG